MEAYLLSFHLTDNTAAFLFLGLLCWRTTFLLLCFGSSSSSWTCLFLWFGFLRVVLVVALGQFGFQLSLKFSNSSRLVCGLLHTYCCGLGIWKHK